VTPALTYNFTGTVKENNWKNKIKTEGKNVFLPFLPALLGGLSHEINKKSLFNYGIIK
jgi:hypothetical protein